MEGEQHPILTFGTTYDLEVMMEFLKPPDDGNTLPSEQHDFVRWLDQNDFPGPQSGIKAVPVENMEVDQIDDQSGEENLYSLLENVAFHPEAEEAEAEGQNSMELNQENSDHQGVPLPEYMPPPHANLEEASGGTSVSVAEPTKRQRKRKAVVVGQRQQPKRECKERQSRKAAFEQEIKSAILQQRRQNRSDIAKEEHQQARRNTSSR